MTESIKKKNPWLHFINAYINYSGFNGRVNRAEYWWFHIFFFIISAVFLFLLNVYIENDLSYNLILLIIFGTYDYAI
ncbi:MAG: DUF805 domain-containing protein [Treponema sp.]|nr:DUF805 domain-containing protein [Treponema sp.]